MNVIFKYGADNIDWMAAAEMLRKVEMGVRVPEQLQAAFQNSYAVCTAYLGNRFIGFGRAISDGFYQSAIYDVVVLPEYQHQGVGQSVVRALLKKLPERSIVLIYAVPGKEAFYEKLGFHRLETGMGRFPQPELSRAKGYIK